MPARNRLKMLSYEEIFKRHSRPVTFLNRHLDSPVTRIPTPVILRNPVAYKERRRPTSIACLDTLYSYRQKDVVPRIFTDDHRLSPADSTLRTFNKSPRLPLRENTDFISGVKYRLPSKDSKPKILHEDDRLSSKDTTTTILSDRRLSKENKPRILSDSHGYFTKESKTKNFSDNYRHAISFPDRHLSRREIPLCTRDDLLEIIREPTGYYALPTDPWNEVYPNVYLGDAPTALCTSVLKSIGITHVLNAAQGREKNCGQVNTAPGFYLQSGIKFLGVPAFDNIVFRIYPYFDEAAQFIEEALKSKGKVLVHCRAGISRSATLVCAFLMIKRGMTAQEAVRTVRKHREIIPNDGFLQQLCDLNDRLKRNPRP